jgi:Lar family restriction alleviation protein
MDDLSPCPFCGGSAEINQIGNDHTKSRGFEVKCLTWGCATKKRAMVIRQPMEKAREFAIAAWNRRPTSSAPDDGAARVHDRSVHAEPISPLKHPETAVNGDGE